MLFDRNGGGVGQVAEVLALFKQEFLRMLGLVSAFLGHIAQVQKERTVELLGRGEMLGGLKLFEQ